MWHKVLSLSPARKYPKKRRPLDLPSFAFPLWALPPVFIRADLCPGPAFFMSFMRFMVNLRFGHLPGCVERKRGPS